MAVNGSLNLVTRTAVRIQQITCLVKIIKLEPNEPSALGDMIGGKVFRKLYSCNFDSAVDERLDGRSLERVNRSQPYMHTCIYIYIYYI